MHHQENTQVVMETTLAKALCSVELVSASLPAFQSGITPATAQTSLGTLDEGQHRNLRQLPELCDHFPSIHLMGELKINSRGNDGINQDFPGIFLEECSCLFLANFRPIHCLSREITLQLTFGRLFKVSYNKCHKCRAKISSVPQRIDKILLPREENIKPHLHWILHAGNPWEHLLKHVEYCAWL